MSFKKFTSICTVGNDNLSKMKNLYCYGAALMLPILYYYYPALNDAVGILDSNPSKANLKYANISTEIIYDNKLILNDKSICIGAVATRSAHRSIVKQLIDRDVRYIYSPFGII